MNKIRVEKIDKAADLLSFYLHTVFRKAGLRWENDNFVECREIVTLIVEAADAKPEAK